MDLVKRGRLGAEDRYGAVILLILIAYFVSVLNLGAAWTGVVVFVQVLTVYVVFSVSESPRATRITGWLLVVVAVVALVGTLTALRSGTETSSVRLLYGLSVLLYLIAPFVIGRHLFERRVVDRQTLFGAVAIYLLLGMLFAFTYRLVGSLQSEPFFSGVGEADLSEYLFFSFITLTTVGYGNLVPTTNPGQSLAVLEAIAGQLFLITAVGKVVTSWTPKRTSRSGDESGPVGESGPSGSDRPLPD